MKLINLICRLLLGGLFIFSGIVKLNDPFGTAYMLEEYLHVFSSDFSTFFSFFLPYTLFLSVLLCALEVILGIAILLYYRMSWTMTATLLLIVFFTFLTFYSFYFDKVKECGCFGTFIKMTPKESFYKNVISLVFVLILFFQRKKLASLLSSVSADITMAFTSLLIIWIGYYSAEHLPFTDTLSYKIGNNIPELMQPKEKPRYKWIMVKDGKDYEFDDKNYPSDTTFKYKGHVLLTDSAKMIPDIVGLRIENEEGDITSNILSGEKLLIVIPYVEKATKNCNGRCMDRFNTLIKALEKDTKVSTFVLAGHSNSTSIEEYRHEMQLAAPYAFTDETILKTMVRSNPGLLLLKDGIVKGKWHYNDVPEAEQIKKLLQ